MPIEHPSPREMIEDAKQSDDKVLRCEPDGVNTVEFSYVDFVGAPGGQWVQTRDDWEESHICEETHVTSVAGVSEPSYSLVPESESHFAELREENDGGRE